MKEHNPLDQIEPRGHDPGYDGRASRVAGGERFAPAVSRPKPLHWTRILTTAAVLGGIVGAAVGALLAASGDPLGAAVLGAPVGVGAGLLSATVLEHRGTFRRVDEL